MIHHKSAWGSFCPSFSATPSRPQSLGEFHVYLLTLLMSTAQKTTGILELRFKMIILWAYICYQSRCSYGGKLGGRVGKEREAVVRSWFLQYGDGD